MFPDVRAHVVALAAMYSRVACREKRDQVLLGVGSRMAAELPVVHLKIRPSEMRPPWTTTMTNDQDQAT